MAGQAKRATELRELAELVADTLTNFDAAKYAADPEHYYRPTITSGAVAAAYDAAMARARCPVRAWRGSKAEAGNLHARIAGALGWTEDASRGFSLAALRDLVRPVSAKLAHEITVAMSGAVVGEAA